VTVRLYKNPALSGTEGVDYTFTDVEPGESTMEYTLANVGLTDTGRLLQVRYIVAGRKFEDSVPTSNYLNNDNYQFETGHTYSFVTEASTVGIDVKSAMNWQELF